MEFATDDLRIANIRPLLPPAILIEEFPATPEIRELVAMSRKAVADVLHGRDDRLVVVVGPCSVHDPVAGLEYAKRLKPLADELRDDLFV
ncbi:MAG: 3-deoxy-7-phosphoheptulonate synthase, partial [Polyangiaceae bacterium]|nr:3-deoxy-7-phosphoheptulonate synthase [Polyangiaceae bacterium]